MDFKELWPLPIPGIVVVTGGYWTGKSTFTLGTGAPMQDHVVFDFEKSQEAAAEQLAFEYNDVGTIMNSKYPSGYQPWQMYEEIVPMIDAIKPGTKRILVLDNASPLEDAHAGIVDKYPQKFGLSQNQLEKSGGLKWGAIKSLYFQNLTRWKSKFDMVFVVVQLRDKYIGNTVVKDAFGKAVQEPKGKETLEMLSSLFVWLKMGPGGIPSALVLKSRIDKKVYVEDPSNPPEGIPPAYLSQLKGEPGLVSVPVLPLRIPKCTWPEIREYMRHPADLFNPKPGEVPDKKEMTEDERLELRALISQNEMAIAEAEQKKQEAEAQRLYEQRVSAFLRTAASLGYKTADGQPDKIKIREVMSGANLYPYDYARHEETIQVLKEALNGK